MKIGYVCSIVLHFFILGLLIYTPKKEFTAVTHQPSSIKIRIPFQIQSLENRDGQNRQIGTFAAGKTLKKKKKHIVKKNVLNYRNSKKNPTTRQIKREKVPSVFDSTIQNKGDSVSEEILTLIKKQIESNWNFSPCYFCNTNSIKVQVVIDSNCHLIYRGILGELNQENACAQSIIRAVRDARKLNLSNCGDRENTAIILHFKVPSY